MKHCAPRAQPSLATRQAGCRIGVDYPKPIVQHELASKENMGKMAEAYKLHNEGGAGKGGAAKAKAKPAGAKAKAAGGSKNKRERDSDEEDEDE